MTALLLLLATAHAAPFRLDRVDLLWEDPGAVVGSLGVARDRSTTVTAIRFVEQVKPVIATPVEGLSIGVSLASQSVVYEQPILGGLGLTTGVQTRLGLPRGAILGAHLRVARLRLGASANLLSGATWTRPDWSVWRIVPGIGIGIGARRPSR